MIPMLSIMIEMLAPDLWRWVILYEDDTEDASLDNYPSAELALANAREYMFLHREFSESMTGIPLVTNTLN